MRNIKSVITYAKKVIPLVGLSDWQITIKEGDTEDEEIIAQISLKGNYKKATIFIYDIFWDLDLAEQKQSIIHELLHCHFGFWKVPIYSLYDDPIISKARYTDIFNRIVDQEETPVEILSRSIYALIEGEKHPLIK